MGTVSLLTEALKELALVEPKQGTSVELATAKLKIRAARRGVEMETGPTSIEQGARLNDAPWSDLTWDRWEVDVGKKASILSYGQPFGRIEATPLSLCGARGATPLVTIMTEGTTMSRISAGRDDAWIDAIAGALAWFGKRVLLRFAHEFNGDWYEYGWRQVTALEYRRAFRRLSARVRAQAPLVEMVWCPNILGGSSVVDPQPWYPGPEAVQILGVDGYGRGLNPLHPTDLFEPTVDRLMEIGPNRPIFICETGCEEGPNKPWWLKQLLTDTLPRELKRIRGLCYFNGDPVEDGKKQTWPIQSSQEATLAYRQGLSSSYYR